MSFQRKIIFLFFILLFSVPAASIFYYKKNKPKPIVIVPREEKTITIIPGWNLRNIAEYFVKNGIISTTEQFYILTGEPANEKTDSYTFSGKILSHKPASISLEGYLAPQTYRIFKDATAVEVIQKLISEAEKGLAGTSIQGGDFHSTLTLASLIEDEARTLEDRKMVADILLRRLKKGWALQLDSTVHYAVDKTGTVFTTEKDRSSKSPWNTYQNRGLPPGPICSPSLDSVEAALNPSANDYWYFLSGNDGKMHYAKTLDEHTANRYKYLR